jgi:hypothetical protein
VRTIIIIGTGPDGATGGGPAPVQGRVSLRAYAPFRWDVRARRPIRRLLAGRRAPSYPGFRDDLLDCCARVVARSGGGDLFFVGRSPESLFDHLRGLLGDTSWSRRLALVPLSLRDLDDHPDKEPLVRAYLDSRGLSPKRVIASRRPTTLIDLVWSGGTFGELLRILDEWCSEEDRPALHAQLRFVCIARSKWRGEAADWMTFLPRRVVRTIIIKRKLWHYLADSQAKTMPSFTPDLWGDPDVLLPLPARSYGGAVKLARELFLFGCARRRRAELALRIKTLPSMRQRWLRDLVREL